MRSVSFKRLRRQLPLFGLFASGSLALLGSTALTRPVARQRRRPDRQPDLFTM
jgi:hypothetical protein